MKHPAPVLLFACGNPGRGDDGLGPAFIERISNENIPGIECESDMQLQIEHVTDLRERDMVVFVDADVSCSPPFVCEPLEAAQDDSYSSHAMSPASLLYTYRLVYAEQPPPAFVLRIRGYDFSLGASLGSQAAGNLDAALDFARGWLHDAALPGAIPAPA